MPDPIPSELVVGPPAATLAEMASIPTRRGSASSDWVRPSFDAVYRAHAKTVARWAARLLGPTGDSDDVVQEVFLVVERRLPEFRGDAAITTWLHEITLRVVQDSRRRARWWSWLTGRGPDPSRGQKRFSFVPSADSPSDPQALLEAQERTLLLYRLLDELGEVYRTTFILFELEGLSGEQIAEITATPVGTVWVRLSRARSKFLERLRAWEKSEAREKP